MQRLLIRALIYSNMCIYCSRQATIIGESCLSRSFSLVLLLTVSLSSFKMSFAFGFAGDDIDSDDSADELVECVERLNIDDTLSSIPPKCHNLQELVSQQ
jgi:hypothetical protein